MAESDLAVSDGLSRYHWLGFRYTEEYWQVGESHTIALLIPKDVPNHQAMDSRGPLRFVRLLRRQVDLGSPRRAGIAYYVSAHIESGSVNASQTFAACLLQRGLLDPRRRNW